MQLTFFFLKEVESTEWVAKGDEWSATLVSDKVWSATLVSDEVGIDPH